MKFFNAEISRLVLGTNPFYGFSHYNNTYSTICGITTRRIRCAM